MKKLVLFIIILIIVIGIVLIIFKINNKTSIIDLKDNEMLEVQIENILSVRMRESTEGGYLYYKTEDGKTIEKIYNALKNIKIGNKVDINVVDNCRDYIFDLNDGNQKVISFQSSFYYENNNTYEIENYKELKQIQIPKTENWD